MGKQSVYAILLNTMTQFCRFVSYMPLHIKVHASISLKHTCTSVVAHTQTHREQYSDDI